MLPYGIGLDIGIASVGWATVGLDASERPFCILGMGSRIFDKAEQPKTGASLALPRREARSLRRRLRRHRHRNERIKNLLLNEQIITNEELNALFSGKLSDIYELRTAALDRLLDNREFARVLIHIAQRRGFRSNRKNAKDQEDGKLLEAVNKNKQRMEEKGYRTVAEMLVRDELFRDHKRNKGGDYLTTVTRAMMENEVHCIFNAQRMLDNTKATKTLENDYLEILLSQRSFDEGPGGNSPYGGSQIERMIGKCTFYPEEPRAAKAAYTFEYFNLLEKINHIRLVHLDGTTEPLTDFQRKSIVELAHKSENLSYDKIRRELHISPDCLFNTVRYTADGVEACEKKEKINCLKAYHELRRVLDKVEKGTIETLSNDERDAIGTILSIYKTSEKVRTQMASAGIKAEIIDALDKAVTSFSKFGHLSLKACREIIPFLEKGMTYSDACTEAGLDFKAHSGKIKSELLHPTEEDYADLTSPIVKRAASQTIKVINAIIRKQGYSPTYINIEVAREMSKNFKERDQISKKNEENRAKNEKALERIRTEYSKPNASGLDLVKMKLYEDQDGVCAYSQKQISFEHLFEPNYAEIDHIIPYSKCFDDSYNNKVLVLAKENREKGNRLPLQYLDGERRNRFIVWVNSKVSNYRKKMNLLRETMTEEEEKQFKERNLQDTKTASSFLLNFINDHLEFAPSIRRKKRVTAVSGGVTSYMRKRWGITKIRENGDLHHAVDALVVACTTDGMIQQVTKYSQYRECRYIPNENGSMAVDPDTGELLKTFPLPWKNFHEDTFNEIEKAFVSRMPVRKVTGAAHKETFKSPKALDEGLLIVRKPLTELKLTKGEIENYYRPEADPALYNGLKERLAAFGGDAKKAFAEPFRKPGNPDRIVKKVRLYEKSTLNVPVLGGEGRADNESMVRVDVFQKDGKYCLVPIYVADILKPELPNKACVAYKPYEEWEEMKDEDFIFSLYPNDLVHIKHKKTIKLTNMNKDSTLPPTQEDTDFYLYYKGMDISTGSLSFINHDNTYGIRGFGIKTLLIFEKYTVDVLGVYHKVNKEKRQIFRKKEE